MGDTLVDDVMETLESTAFANSLTHHRPIVDALVNRLRESGMTDEQIRAALVVEV